MPKKPPSRITEGEIIKRCRPHIRRYARKVRYPGRLDMTVEDVEQDLAATIVEFIRHWRGSHHRDPDPKLIYHSLKWRVHKLARASCTKSRYAMSRERDPLQGDLDLLTMHHADRVEARERDAACEALVFALRGSMPVADMALLWLRHGEGMSNSEIGRVLGTHPQTIAARLRAATAKARTHLDGLGISNMDQIRSMSQQEVPHVAAV